MAHGSPEQVRDTIDALRHKALALPFDQVTEMLEFRGKDCIEAASEDPHAWLKIQSIRTSIHPASAGAFLERCYPVQLIGFTVQPGKGSEPANFGLCRYGGIQELLPTLKAPDWSWASFCKTVYSGAPESGGVANFLKCHIGLIKLLDSARELGVFRTAQDDGKYWEQRSLMRLLRRVGYGSKEVLRDYRAVEETLKVLSIGTRTLEAELRARNSRGPTNPADN